MFENALLKLEVDVDEIAPHDPNGPNDCTPGKLRPQLSEGIDIIQAVNRNNTRGAASLTPSENMKEIKSSMEKLGKGSKKNSDSTIERHPRLLKFVHGPLDVGMAVLVPCC